MAVKFPLIFATAEKDKQSERPPKKKITLAASARKIISEDKADSSPVPVLSSFLAKAKEGPFPVRNSGRVVHKRFLKTGPRLAK